MANKNLFRSIVGKLIPAADAVNDERAPAYSLSAKHTLAQYAATGCLNATFYATAETQLKKVIELCDNIDPEFIARTAVYARERGFMKDMPALLCAVLSVKDRALLGRVFPRVIDNGKMLRNFVQIMRSGAVGRKSLGTAPKRLVREWFETRSDDKVFNASVGQNPSMADIVKMVHPKPKTQERAALYRYFTGRRDELGALPQVVSNFEAFKSRNTHTVPDVPFQMLTALELLRCEWAQIAERASWQTLRMNLNTFARHGVFQEPGLTASVTEKLRDPAAIRKARVLPYQLMVAYANTDSGVPSLVREALQDAMEIAIANVPKFDGKVFVCPDVSGSMNSPVTGHRKSASSKVRCIDVAAMVAAAILRKNSNAELLPFEGRVVKVRINTRDSVMTNAQKLASIGGGGTNCSAPLKKLNGHRAAGDLVVFISDNESWMDKRRGRGTATMHEWQKFKSRNPGARLVCIDLQPYGTTQAIEQEDILNIGGFSDHVFEVIRELAAGRLCADHWVGVIESINV